MTSMRTPPSREEHYGEAAISPKSSRSSVLERARAYNQRIEGQRSKSLDRTHSHDDDSPDTTSPSRSQSTGRGGGNRAPTRERAMESVRQEEAPPRESPRQDGQQVVTPELLVDALSGHEDGLLAIAERLMEHYDSGYDVMGEAIIDAFADVQKLFQHVVEAAHMEGAAFEASRREAEMAELREQAKNASAIPDDIPAPVVNNAGGPTRHDEFIDQDVKDVLSEAIRKGAPLRDKGKHSECYELYEAACQSASSLLPVDSDHRGRLQLSIARSESMSADRACAILRYAMDDVMRSGLRAGRASLPEVSKRSDSVLPKPKDHPSLNGTAGQTGVIQSSEEALASLVEEMKEVMGAPVYNNTPLQDVAKRFWVALSEAQRAQLKNEEKLEQSLAKLKGEYLLARAEWEEKLNKSREQTENYKRKYLSLKETSQSDKYMEHARAAASRIHRNASGEDDDANTAFDSVRSRGPGSVASISSGLAQSARSIAGSFNCAGVNDRSTVLIETEMGTEDRSSGGRRSRSSSAPRSDRQHSSDRSASASMSSRPSSSSRSSVRRSRSNRSFREV